MFRGVSLIVWKEMALTERLLFELFIMFKMPNKLFILKPAFLNFLWRICNTYLEYPAIFSEALHEFPLICYIFYFEGLMTGLQMSKVRIKKS